MDDTIGVDISKPTLDAFRLRTREHRQFANDRAGCAALIRWIGASAVRVVFEPTGPYHRLFEASLVAAGIEAVKVNPRSSRRFAEATGELAKTDRIDAAILARMGAVLDLEGRPAKTETLHDLRELGVARQALVKDRIAATNREQIAVNPVIRRQLRARLKQITIQLKEVDDAIASLVNADPGLSRRRDVLTSIPGIGTVTAMAILIEMPELGTLDNKQAASLAGLAPMTRQSGTWSGRAGMWMTPTARDHKDGATSLLNTPVNGLLGRQVLVTPMAGRDTCGVRRTLNPLFVEALMGWPTGWTGFASVATAWSPWLRRMRCELSRLNCWPMDEVAA